MEDKGNGAPMYMMLKNSILMENFKMNIIDIHFTLESDLYHYNSFNCVLLFEEIKRYNQMGLEFDNFAEKILSLQLDPKFPQKLVEYHMLLGFMMIYCPKLDMKAPDMPHFNFLQRIIKKESPLSLDIVEISNSLSQIYSDKYHEKVVVEFLYLFLCAAIVFENEGVINQIFKVEDFNMVMPTFPNTWKNSVTELVFFKFLKCRYEIGRDVLPRSWVTAESCLKYLQSTITVVQDYFKIDTNLMLPFYNQNKTYSLQDKFDDLVYNEDYDTSDFFCKNIPEVLDHPTVQLFTQLKLLKYRMIAYLNVFILVLFMCMSMGLMFSGYFLWFLPVRVAICVCYEYVWYVLSTRQMNEIGWLKHSHILFFVLGAYMNIFALLDIAVLFYQMIPWFKLDLKFYVEAARKIRIFFVIFEHNRTNKSDILLYKVLSVLLNGYPQLHRINCIYVNKFTGAIYILDDHDNFLKQSMKCRKKYLVNLTQYVKPL